MQFSLLNFLIGLPELNALASGAASAEQGQKQGADASLFSELLVDANATGADLQQGQGQGGGDLTQELVANVTVAQEIDGDVEIGDTVRITGIKQLLDHKITPEEARGLLAQMDKDAQSGEQPPEGLKEILEAVEAGEVDVSVQDIVVQATTPQEPEVRAEARQNTVQRVLQWLHHALAPNTAPMEALAAASAANMFPDAETTQVTPTHRGKEKAQTEDVVVMIPMAQSFVEPLKPIQSAEVLPEVELPAVQLTTAAPVDAAPSVEELDSLVLVATKHNQSAQGVAESKNNVMDMFVVDLGDEQAQPTDADMASTLSTQDGDTQNTLVAHTQQQSHSPEARTAENVRIHQANFAYQRSEIMDQVQVGVKQAVRDGVDRITIQLNPQELGRVEVKMDIVADGMSHVSFLVEKQETFDLLQRDARTLERMLQDAGVRADAGSMEFNLRQESQSKEPWGEASGKTQGDDNEISNLSSTYELPTSTYVHLVSDRIDIRA